MSQYGQRKRTSDRGDKKTGKAILMIFMGMVAGLLIAVGVAFYISNMPIPFIKSSQVSETLVDKTEEGQLPALVDGGTDPVQTMPQVDPFTASGEDQRATDPIDEIAQMDTVVKPADDSVAPLQTKPDGQTDKDKKPQNKPEEAAKPQYDFYNVLPKEESRTKPGAATSAQAPVKPKAERYYLQAGAFKSAQDADNLKASLALMGVEAKIQTIIGADNASMHRVRVGPLNSQADAEAMQKRLSGSRVSTDIIKVTP